MKALNGKQWKLTAKFINKTYCGGKLVRESVEEYGYVYFGATQKECKEQAKKSLQYGSNWQYSFELVDIDE